MVKKITAAFFSIFALLAYALVMYYSFAPSTSHAESAINHHVETVQQQ